MKIVFRGGNNIEKQSNCFINQSAFKKHWNSFFEYKSMKKELLFSMFESSIIKKMVEFFWGGK